MEKRFLIVLHVHLDGVALALRVDSQHHLIVADGVFARNQHIDREAVHPRGHGGLNRQRIAARKASECQGETSLLSLLFRQRVDALHQLHACFLHARRQPIEHQPFQLIPRPNRVRAHACAHERFRPCAQGIIENARAGIAARKHRICGQSTANCAVIAADFLPARFCGVHLRRRAVEPAARQRRTSAIRQSRRIRRQCQTGVVALQIAVFLLQAGVQFFS